MRHPHLTRRAASLRLLLSALAVAFLAALAPAAAASAGEPVDLDGAYVLDQAGVLDASGEARVQDAVDTLATERGVNLFVVYTDSFTDPADREQWASEVASINQFGTNDVLLAVAVDDRVYQFSVDQDFSLSDAQLATIESDDIVPALRDEDWAGAGVAAAQGLGEQLGGGGSGGGDGGSGLGGWGWVIAAVIIVGVAGVIVLLVVRRRRGIDRSVTAKTAEAGPSQKELDQRVGAVLVDLDDAVTSSDEELGFAVAQFGAEATRQFSEVLAQVKSSLSEAFTIKQKLDDAVPDTAEERRAWSLQIIALCDAASDALDAQTDAFAALRDVERDPSPALESARRDLEALAAASAQAQERAARLAAAYDAAALTTVTGSLQQADELRAFAAARLDEAAAAIAAGTAAPAALGIRAAQQAVVQATTLHTSLATLETDLGTAGSSLDAAIADAQADLAEVARLDAAAGRTDPALAPLAAALAVELQRARSAGARNPLNARIALERVDAPLDQALAAVRSEQERLARLTTQRDRAITTAQSEIAAAQSFLQTRRGAIGPDARTRLSEAQRHLDQALGLAAGDPEASLREATSAAQLAALASSSAQQDVSWAQSSGGGAYSSSGSSGDGFSGALLGGILGGLLAGGGGGRSGGWSSGGSSWGGGGRSGGWGGGSRGGGFGGGGGSRRSGGSGGGRRGGGGRF